MDDLEHLIKGKGLVSEQWINLKEKFLKRERINNKVEKFIICVEFDQKPKI